MHRQQGKPCYAGMMLRVTSFSQMLVGIHTWHHNYTAKNPTVDGRRNVEGGRELVHATIREIKLLKTQQPW